jgi:hypothetical protein
VYFRLASKSGLPLQFVQAIQMLYEIQTLMVPIVNVSGAPKQFDLPKGYEHLDRIPWRGLCLEQREGVGARGEKQGRETKK